jgi:hypothetical protein
MLESDPEEHGRLIPWADGKVLGAGVRAFAIVSAIVTGLVLMGAAPASAWGPDGHRIVCAIAWDELTPNAQARIKDILHVEDRAGFADTCNWADAYTFYHKETSGWHFVNVPTDARTVDMARDCAQHSCVIAEINMDSTALRTGLTTEPAATLRFLCHFVGDVHMPLHAGFGADRGGNNIKGLYFGAPSNLHLVWDIGLLAHDGRPWAQIADDLHAQITPKERQTWPQSTPFAWANESLAIARLPATGYVSHDPTFALDEAYTRTNLPVALERIKQAGVRLGAMLNGIFG